MTARPMTEGERYAVDLRKVAAEIEELRAALTGLVDIIESAGLLNLSNGVQLGQTSWYVKAVDRLAAAKAALSGIEGEDEQATRGEDAATASISTDTKGTTK